MKRSEEPGRYQARKTAALDRRKEDTAIRRNLEQLAKERPEDCRLYWASRDGQAAEFYIPKGWIRINPPRKAATLSDEQRQQRREQLAKIRKA